MPSLCVCGHLEFLHKITKNKIYSQKGACYFCECTSFRPKKRIIKRDRSRSRKVIERGVTICPECGAELIQPRCTCHMSCRKCGDFQVVEKNEHP